MGRPALVPSSAVAAISMVLPILEGSRAATWAGRRSELLETHACHAAGGAGATEGVSPSMKTSVSQKTMVQDVRTTLSQGFQAFRAVTRSATCSSTTWSAARG